MQYNAEERNSTDHKQCKIMLTSPNAFTSPLELIGIRAQH